MLYSTSIGARVAANELEHKLPLLFPFVIYWGLGSRRYAILDRVSAIQLENPFDERSDPVRCTMSRYRMRVLNETTATRDDTSIATPRATSKTPTAYNIQSEAKVR
jgi:hypothetical protein